MKLSFMVKNFFFRVINMEAWPAYIALVITLHFSVLTVSGQDTNARPSSNEVQEALEHRKSKRSRALAQEKILECLRNLTGSLRRR